MWSISRISERDKITKSSISEHVKKLIDQHGLIINRDNRGRVSAVNIVQYDNLRARYADTSRMQSQAVALPDQPVPLPAPAGPAKSSYDEAMRQRAWHDVEKRRLEVQEKRGLLIRADRYVEAVNRCGGELARIIDRLPHQADALALELDFDDAHRLRIALKGLARGLRIELAGVFGALAAEAPASDEPIASEGIDEVAGPHRDPAHTFQVSDHSSATWTEEEEEV